MRAAEELRGETCFEAKVSAAAVVERSEQNCSGAPTDREASDMWKSDAEFSGFVEPASAHVSPASVTREAPRTRPPARGVWAEQGGAGIMASRPEPRTQVSKMTRILVIDDDRTVLRMISRWFEDTDTEVLTAATAQEGMELVQSQRPDVLLLDIMLPQPFGAGSVSNGAQPGSQVARHLHHGPRQQRDGHRVDEAGGLRLSAKAARQRPRAGSGEASG